MSSEDPASKRIAEAVQRLIIEFQGTIPDETIVRSAEEAIGAYKESRVRDFVPLLVYRSTREYLGTLAQGQAPTSRGTLTHS
jgi:hypothetical protein